jgi:hypothetical protein
MATAAVLYTGAGLLSCGAALHLETTGLLLQLLGIPIQ